MRGEKETDQEILALLDAESARFDELLRAAHRRLDPVLRRIRRPQVEVGITDSPLGHLMVAQGERGLVAMRFLDASPGEGIPAELRERFDLVESPRIATEVAKEIDQLLHGDAEAIAARPVDLSLVESDFQRRALARLRRIPAGAVVTYQGLAGMVSAPSAQRAIGNTVASNPIAIYVPCHRVIKSDGSIGNYGGGVERKLKLLRAEGFSADQSKRVPAEAVYGHLGTRIFCRPTCSAAKRASRERMLIFPGPGGASAAGMRPCKLCHPA